MLTNVARHAAARLVAVDVLHNDDRIEIAIHDDGQGFEAAAVFARAAQGGSFGLLSMRERVELMGGTFNIESAPGRGTTVRIEVPVRSGSGDC